MSAPVGIDDVAENIDAVENGSAVDPRWAGIIEVLVSSLDGEVRWEAAGVVLRLPEDTRVGRVADLDALQLCLVRIGVPVVFQASRAALQDAFLVEFLREMVESGLMVDGGRLAA